MTGDGGTAKEGLLLDRFPFLNQSISCCITDQELRLAFKNLRQLLSLSLPENIRKGDPEL